MIANLSKGFTSNTVIRVDNHIVKTGSNVRDEYDWYTAYKDKADIPLGVCLEGGMLIMKYIDYPKIMCIDDIVTVVEKYKAYPPLNELTYSSYIQRIENHLRGNERITNGDKLILKLGEINLPPTFAHGDLSVYNIIACNTGVKLIDPLYSKNVFGSYVLDYAKLLFSLKFYAADTRSFNYLNIMSIPACLIAAECVRVATYKKQFSFIAENLINEL